MKVDPTKLYLQSTGIVPNVIDTPLQKPSSKQTYPLYQGKVLNVEPSHLWLKRLGASNPSPIGALLKEKIRNEILLDKHDPAFPDKLIETWQKYGFAVVLDKNLNSHAVQETYKTMKVFFAQDPVYKSKLGSPGANNNDGYIPPDTEVSVSAIGNSGEAQKSANVFEMVHRNTSGKNRDIDDDLGKTFKTLTDNLVGMLYGQAKGIARAVSVGLSNKGFLTPDGKELDENYFINLMKDDRGKVDDLNLMRLTHCKAFSLEEANTFSCTLAHTDLNFFTILPTANREGLQIWYEDFDSPENSGWVQLDAPKDSYIVNLADEADILTRGYLRSTPHRVISPLGEDRYSIVFFVNFKRDVDLQKAKLFHPVYIGSSRFEQESVPRINGQNLTAANFANLRIMDIGLIPKDVGRDKLNFIPIEDLEYMKSQVEQSS